MTVSCPRCCGSPAVVCCALCQGRSYVAEHVAVAYKASTDKSVDAAIRIRSSHPIVEHVEDLYREWRS